MGTSTLLLEDNKTQILIDGYFSRVPLIQSAIGWVRPNCDKIKEALRLANAGSPKLRAIFVSHSHIDHVLDAPTIAKSTGSDLIGSRAVAMIAEGHGFGRKVVPIEECAPCTYDDFRVTAIKAPHSTPNLVKGNIDKKVGLRSWARRYKANESYAFLIERGTLRVLVYPSAAYDVGLLRGKCADVVFLGTQGLGRKSGDFVNAYWNETVNLVRARAVFPIHWDNFGRKVIQPLRPFRWPLDDIDRARLRLDTLAKAHHVKISYLKAFEAISLTALAQQEPTVANVGATSSSGCSF